MVDVVIPTSDDVPSTTPAGALVPLVTGATEIKAQAWSQMVAELLAAIRAGANVTIDRTTSGQITIAATAAGEGGASSPPQTMTPTTDTLTVGSVGSTVGASDYATIGISALGTGTLITNLNMAADTFDLKANSYLIMVELTDVANTTSTSNVLQYRSTIALDLRGTLPAGAIVTPLPTYFRGAVRTDPAESSAILAVYLPSDTTGLSLALDSFEGLGSTVNYGYEAEVTSITVMPVGGANDGASFTPSQSNLYPSVKEILQAGANVTVTEDDDAETLTIAASPSTSGGGTFHWVYPSAAQDNTDSGRAAETVWNRSAANALAIRTALNALTAQDGDYALWLANRTSSDDFLYLALRIAGKWFLLQSSGSTGLGGELNASNATQITSYFARVSATTTKGQLNADTNTAEQAGGLSLWDADVTYLTNSVVIHNFLLYIRRTDGAADDATNPEPGTTAASGVWDQIGGISISGLGTVPDGAGEAAALRIEQGGIVVTFEIVDAQARADIAGLQGPPRVKEWVQGREYRTGALAAYDDRVWRCVTVLESSQTAPPFSTHWHVVGGYAGIWNNSHIYQPGEYVKYQSDFYIAVANITGGSAPPSNVNWAHLAPDLEGFRGIWHAGTTYIRGQVVFQSDHFYRCTAETVTSNTGPVTDTDNWDPVGTYHDDWISTRRYNAGDMVRHGADNGIWIAPALIAAGEPAPGAAGATWRRVDDEEIAAWARVSSTDRIPRDRLQPPSLTTDTDTGRISLNWGAATIQLPLAGTITQNGELVGVGGTLSKDLALQIHNLINSPGSVTFAISRDETGNTVTLDVGGITHDLTAAVAGTSPDEDRGGIMPDWAVRKVADLTYTRARGAWVGNQREYAVGDLVHRQYDNHGILARCKVDHSSTSANGPIVAGNTQWDTLLAIPRADWDAADGTPSAIRNKPTIPEVPGVWWRGPWSFEDDYLVNQAVGWEGVIYRCTTAHTAVGAFGDHPDASSNWTPLVELQVEFTSIGGLRYRFDYGQGSTGQQSGWVDIDGAMFWRGAHPGASTVAARGNLWTYQNGLWLCLRATTAVPTEGADWTRLAAYVAPTVSAYTMVWWGDWVTNLAYARGSVVNRGGHTWVALHDNAAGVEPGVTPGTHWDQLDG